jgi:hypothetical protein
LVNAPHAEEIAINIFAVCVKTALSCGGINFHLVQGACRSMLDMELSKEDASWYARAMVDAGLVDHRLTKPKVPGILNVAPRFEVLPEINAEVDRLSEMARKPELLTAPAKLDMSRLIRDKRSLKTLERGLARVTKVFSSVGKNTAAAKAYQRLANVGYRWVPGIDHLVVRAQYEGTDPLKRAGFEELKADLARATLMASDEAHFYSMIVDSRGRVYRLGGRLTPETSPLVASSLMFADAAPVDNFEIQVALGRLVPGCPKTATNEEAAALAASYDFSDVLEAQALLHHPEHAICSIDACQSGAQIMGALQGSKALAELTNITGNEVSRLYDVIAEILGTSGKEAKAITIPVLYTVGADGLVSELERAGFPRSKEEVQNYLRLIRGSFPELFTLSDAVRARAAACKPGSFKEDDIAFRKRYGLPTLNVGYGDGFTMSYSTHSVATVGSNDGSFKLAIKASEEVAWKEHVTSVTANLVHGLDALLLRKVVNRVNFPVLTIHDKIGCHSSNVAALREAVMASFRELCEEDMLQHVLGQVRFHSMETMYPRLNKPISPEMVNNPYMFM